ncbi:MAG: alpha/beta hydrolase, partial [Oscillospiraceae bacterium]
LSKRADLTQKAIIDGSICYPQPLMGKFCIATVKLLGRFMFSEKSCRWQLAAMPMMVPKKMLFSSDIKELYIQDMPLTPLKTLISMYNTYMIGYSLKESLKDTTAQVQYWYGEKEMKCVKKSAQKFCELVPGCTIYEAKGYNHGYLAVYLPNEWLTIAKPFFDAE